MKFNPLILLAGGCLVGVLTLMPFIAQADSMTALMPIPEAIEELNLTTDQEAQLTAIRRDTRSQLEAAVSAAQRQQFKTTLQQGGSFRQAVTAMNLTPDQRQQVRSIFQSARQQGATVLTPAQKQQLRQMMLSHLNEEL